MVFQNNLIAGASGAGVSPFNTELIGNSVWMDGSADGITKPASEFDAEDGKEFTLGTWFQLTEFGVTGALFCAGNGSGTYTSLRHDGDNKIYFQTEAGSHILSTTAVFRDVAWYHVLVSVDTTQATNTNRVKIFINGVEAALTGTYPAENHAYDFNLASVHEVGDSYENGAFEGYLAQSFMIGTKSIQQSDFAITDFLDSQTFGSNGSQFIPKEHSEIKTLVDTGSDNSFFLDFSSPFGGVAVDDSGSTKSGNMTGNGGLAAIFDGDTTKNNSEVGSGANTSSNDSFVVVDHGSAKTVTKFKAYGSSDAQGMDGDTGGSVMTFTLAGSTDNFSSSNVALFAGTVSDPGAGGTHTVSSGITSGSFRYHKMTVQTNTTNSGQQFGQLAELEYYEGNGLGTDLSDNNNHFVETSMSAANQSTSSPSSAFCTWNPLRVNTQTQTFAEGNLRFSSSQTSTNPAATGNYGVSSGKFYWEVFVVAQGNTSNMLGICDVAAGLEDDNTALYASALMYAYEFDGEKRNNNSSSSYGDAIATNDIVGIALDMDNGGVYFSKNGTFQASGDPTSGASLTNAAFTGLKTAGSGIFQPYYLAYSNGDGVANFGQSPTFNGQTTAGGNSDTNSIGNFKYSVPSGYSALTSANLTAPEKQGVDYFKPVLYTGNGTAIGSGGKAVTGVGFQPDWTWIKNRDATDSHGLYDIVRGVTKQIESDNTSVQTTEAEGLTTFGSDGFTVGNLDQVNTNTEDFVSWNWLGNNATESISADGSNPTLASTNTASDNGSFGICTYTGDTTAGSTVKHSLDGIPEMIFFKRYGSTTANWMVYHKDTGTGNSDYLMLDTNGVKGGAGAVNWLNATTPTSTLVTLGSDSNVNASDTYIMYLFRSIAGVCKVGNYVGTGSATAGPYIDLGFKPAFFLTKSVGTEQWLMLDNQRPTYNPTGAYLFANLVNAEGGLGSEYVDFLSSGIKLRTTGASANGNGVNFVYLAMADIGGNGTLPPVYGK
mgnify:FL=1